jgi:ribosome-binding protein aMBF1 (putative translation factor)
VTDKQKSARDKANASSESEQKQTPHSNEEAKVWAALEQARQNVKPIVKKEREAEALTADLLNLRLKAV